ncbi:MAG TPA: hypothetical protein VGL39_27945 [Jatrophihabitantaceae bacterium]|jgi:hypothetical protein
MKLYTLTGAAGVSHEDHGEFEVDDDGGVELPPEFGEYLHRTHVGGVKSWETQTERHDRLIAEELERRRDPAQLYDLLAQQIDPKPTDPAELNAEVLQAVVDEAVAKAVDAERARVAAEAQAKAAADAADAATQPPAPAKPAGNARGKKPAGD